MKFFINLISLNDWHLHLMTSTCTWSHYRCVCHFWSYIIFAVWEIVLGKSTGMSYYISLIFWSEVNIWGNYSFVNYYRFTRIYFHNIYVILGNSLIWYFVYLFTYVNWCCIHFIANESFSIHGVTFPRVTQPLLLPLHFRVVSQWNNFLVIKKMTTRCYCPALLSVPNDGDLRCSVFLIYRCWESDLEL